MTNDGWGKAKGWGKPTGWTTQQAVDKAVDVLNEMKPLPYTEDEVEDRKAVEILTVPTETIKNIKDLADITKPNEGWVTGLDLGSKDKTVVTTIDKGELEFLLAREVKLNLNSKLFTVDAIQVGDLVIWDDGEFFCISHVPTLARFMNAVPTEDDKEYEHDSLVLWCTKVQRSHHEEWKILRALTPQNHSTKNTEAAEAALRLREWCLSVPIE